MSNIRILNQIYLYDEDTFTNQPDELRLKYLIDKRESLSKDYRLDRVIPGNGITDLGLTDGPYSWLYLVVDQVVTVRFDANVDDTCILTPSAMGVMDGILIKRGEFTNIAINVPGTSSVKMILLAGV